ncbi:MAG: YkgJ family cysteine cluster protein [Kiritimatiellae bacterium]|nr:YkgJ family cysteine cluster protein [Kiritimatiellia bacterium]
MPESFFQCQHCGACCRWPGSVLLTAADVVALARHLNMTEGEFIQQHTTLARNRAQLTLKEQADGACAFLTADNRCAVYPARPKQCRDFPHGWTVAGCPAVQEPAVTKPAATAPG